MPSGVEVKVLEHEQGTSKDSISQACSDERIPVTDGLLCGATASRPEDHSLLIPKATLSIKSGPLHGLAVAVAAGGEWSESNVVWTVV